MNLSDFSFDLPQELIAQYPLLQRDQARLMVVNRRKNTIEHHTFSEIGDFLPKESLLVLNDSRVIPARLLGQREKTGGKVEIFLIRQLPDGQSYEALIQPLKRLNEGERIVFEGSKIYVELIDAKKKIVRFSEKNIARCLEKLGHVPLPPYIRRPDDLNDKEFYQTVYARNDGSVASPTAGLHFTQELLNDLKVKKHKIEHITLHINQATFKPVTEENILNHPMHYETYSVDRNTFASIQWAKTTQKKVVAIGTTSCRVIESLGNGDLPLKGQTNIFIYPGYHFKMTDILVTNFHLPKSTLLMLVYAFASPELMKRAYQEAIKEKYRFYSYGDAMVII